MKNIFLVEVCSQTFFWICSYKSKIDVLFLFTTACVIKPNFSGISNTCSLTKAFTLPSKGPRQQQQKAKQRWWSEAFKFSSQFIHQPLSFWPFKWVHPQSLFSVWLGPFNLIASGVNCHKLEPALGKGWDLTSSNVYTWPPTSPFQGHIWTHSWKASEDSFWPLRMEAEPWALLPAACCKFLPVSYWILGDQTEHTQAFKGPLDGRYGLACH